MKTDVQVYFCMHSNHWRLSYVENGIKSMVDLNCKERKNGHQMALAEARKYIGDIPVRVKG